MVIPLISFGIFISITCGYRMYQRFTMRKDNITTEVWMSLIINNNKYTIISPAYIFMFYPIGYERMYLQRCKLVNTFCHLYGMKCSVHTMRIILSAQTSD